MNLSINGSISGDIGGISINSMDSIELVRTDKNIHFTDQIPSKKHENEFLITQYNKYLIHGITIQSKQKLKYKLVFWCDETFGNSDMNSDKYIGDVNLDMNGDSVFKIDGTYQYRLNCEDVKILYYNTLTTNKLYMSLVNMSNTDKLSGTNGEVQINIKLIRRM